MTHARHMSLQCILIIAYECHMTNGETTGSFFDA